MCRWSAVSPPKTEDADAERRVAGQRDRLSGLFDQRDPADRREDLAAPQLQPGEPPPREQHQARHGLARCRHPSDDQPAARRQRRGESGLGDRLVPVDLAGKVNRRIVRIADDDGRDGRDKRRFKLGPQRSVHQDALGRKAQLPGIRERAQRDRGGGLADVGTGQDDQRVVA